MIRNENASLIIISMEKEKYIQPSFCDIDRRLRDELPSKTLKTGKKTEVGRRAGRETSVQNDENEQKRRKSASMQGEKLPSKTSKTSKKDGSRQACRERNFR